MAVWGQGPSGDRPPVPLQLPRGMLPAFQALVDGFLAPTTGSTGWSRGGSRAIPATAALVTVRGEPVGAWACGSASGTPTGRGPAGPGGQGQHRRRRGVDAQGMRCTMQPRIDRTQFGSITIDGKVFEHDALIRLGGQVEKRKKKLSKAVYGTSHTVSLAEAKHVYQKGPRA